MFKKKSFFERLTGGMRVRSDENEDSDSISLESGVSEEENQKNALSEEGEGQLSKRDMIKQRMEMMKNSRPASPETENTEQAEVKV